MIISKQKEFTHILNRVENNPVFIIGCSECATLCRTGGEKEVLEMRKKLRENGVEVTGWVVLDPACHFLNDKRLLRKHHVELDEAKKILVLACGNGVQTVAEILRDKDVVAGTDTLFLGEIKHVDEFERKCEMCGDCLLDSFMGLCPVALCPKNMLNGPCGGSVDGKCEVSSEHDCVWDKIYWVLKEKKQLKVLKKIQDPKKWSKTEILRRKIGFYD